ncbi:GNAT family N-acetyltransferase [Clostridium oceanicum]|uniref:GNAT family N-acetyltransferase n=1 Tax=Clostridium oceanicum TaxID=1543 RepID=A0ABN1JIX6_9CLOT
MSKIRNAKRKDFTKVINLINHVFRESRGYKPTMEKEFPLLLSYNNLQNMIGFYNGDIPISEVNFLEENIFIEGSFIKVASIGAVCTDESYRGENYASLVLDEVENRMYKQGVDIALISGDRSLYTRRGYMKVKDFYKYRVLPKEKIYINFDLREYKEEYLKLITEMYNLNSTRYYRSYDEFKTLINSATIPWGDISYKKYVIFKDENLIGYIVLRIINEKERYGEVVECFGNCYYIYDLLETLERDLELEYIDYYVHIKDERNKLDKYDEICKDYLHGTVKIINFLKLMNDLRGYFSQYVSESVLNEIKFLKDENGYGIKIKDEIIYIKEIGKVTQLVFEGIEYHKLDYDLSNLPNIEKFLKAVFPIPFVWTKNLNYQ